MASEDGETPVVYLAGPVGHVDGGGADWRLEIQELFADEYEFRDPLSKYNIPADDLDIVAGTSNPDNEETVGVTEIVEGDKQLLRESDGVLVGYSAVRSVGTPMEVMWARERGYPVALWIQDGTPTEALSPWYRYHATAITTTAGMGLSHIARQASESEPELLADGVGVQKRLAFADELVQAVIDGEKTATVRYGTRKNLEVGDTVRAVTEAGSTFAALEIRRTATVNAVEAHSVIELFGAEYSSETPQDVIDGLQQYYDEPIRPGTPVQVFVFDVQEVAADGA